MPIFYKNNKSATASISGRFNPSEVFKYWFIHIKLIHRHNNLLSRNVNCKNTCTWPYFHLNQAKGRRSVAVARCGDRGFYCAKERILQDWECTWFRDTGIRVQCVRKHVHKGEGVVLHGQWLSTPQPSSPKSQLPIPNLLWALLIMTFLGFY